MTYRRLLTGVHTAKEPEDLSRLFLERAAASVTGRSKGKAASAAGSDWRGIFLVNVPVGAAALLASRRWLPASRADQPTGTDPVGTALLAAALLCLLMPLSEGASLGWPAWNFALLVAAPVLGCAFAVWELRREARGGTPLVPSAVLKPLSVRASLATTLPFFAAFSGFMFVYALATQRGLGLGPLHAGLAFVPAAVAFGVGSLSSPALLRRWGPRVVALGTVGQCTAMAALSLQMFATWPGIPVVGGSSCSYCWGSGRGAR